MGNIDDRLEQEALLTYERVSRRLEVALAEQEKFPPRGRRTTAYAALQGRINRLRKIQASAHARYVRRQREHQK